MFEFYLRQKRKQPFLKTAQEFGVNIHCQGGASSLKIILNFAEFLFLLKSKSITSEFKVARSDFSVMKPSDFKVTVYLKRCLAYKRCRASG